MGMTQRQYVRLAIVWSVGIVASLTAVREATAVDAEDVASKGPCSMAVSKEAAQQLATFRFIRKDGFECASRVIDALSGSPDATASGLSVSLFWRLVSEARVAPERREWIRPIITKLRLGADQNLAAHARLANLRLRVDAGETLGPEQSAEALAGIGPADPSISAAASQPIDPEYRSAVQWAIKNLLSSLTNFSSGIHIDLRRQRVADIGRFMAGLSVNNPEALKAALSPLMSGQQFTTTGASTIVPSTLGSMLFKGQVDVCASTECSRLPIETSGLSGQGVMQNLDQKPSSARVNLFYTLKTEQVSTPTCAPGTPSSPTCVMVEREIGRTYVVNGYGYVRGGSRYKDAVLGSIKGQTDTPGHANYAFEGTVSIPGCNDLTLCDPTVDVWFDAHPNEAWAGTQVKLSGPNQSSITLIPKEPVQVDRSNGAHELKFTVSRNAGALSGEGGAQFDQLARLFVVRSTPPLRQALGSARAMGMSRELYSAIPVISAAYLIRLAPQGLTAGQPYYGLAQAFTQTTGTEFDGRWANTYLAHWYSRLISERLVDHIGSVEQRELAIHRGSIAARAVLNFRDPVNSQIKVLKSILAILTPHHIDNAISAIQVDQPLSNAISPLLNIYLQQDTLPLSKLSESESNHLREALRQAVAADNLLAALSHLYAARHQIDLARSKIITELDALIVEESFLRPSL